MAHHPWKCATLAALFGFAPALAQQTPPEARNTAGAIVAAKLLEERGDFAAAERTLRDVLAQASADQKPGVAQELAALLRRLGRAKEADELLGASRAPAPGQDPLAELVQILDRDLLSETVDIAKKELGMLGPLAVPALLAALPKFGPFGLTNALELLQQQNDPRIGPALRQLADAADPSVHQVLAATIEKFPPGVSVPFAQAFSAPDRPLPLQIAALRVLVALEPDAAATKELALRLAADPTGTAQSTLGSLLEQRNVDWLVDVCAILKDHGSGDMRAWATQQWLLLQPNVTEEQALAVLGGLPADWVPTVGYALARKRPDWVQVALFVLRQIGSLDANKSGNLLGTVEWWRSPDTSARELLRLPSAGLQETRTLHNVIADLASRGWQLSPELDLACAPIMVAANHDWRPFLAALPADAEERAIAVWDSIAPNSRLELARAVVQAERPWHRLVARELLRAPTANSVSDALLRRDWRGAGPEVVAMLTQLAERWPENPTGGALGWHQALASAWQRCPDLPSSVLLPIAVNCQQAWEALAERTPQELLALVREKGLPTTFGLGKLLHLLERAGGRADVPQLLRMLPRFDVEWPNNSDVARARQFLQKHGGGHLDVIRLGVTAVGAQNATAVEASTQAQIADLGDLLALLPILSQNCATAVCGALAPQVAPQHADALVRAAETLLGAPLVGRARHPRLPSSKSEEVGPLPTAEQFLAIHRLLSLTRDPRAVAVARRLFAMEGVPASVSIQVAAWTIPVAGAEQRAFVLELLGSQNPALVQPAITAAVLRDDAEVQLRRREALLRLGDRIDGSDAFEAFGATDRLAVAEAVLASDRFSSFTGDLAEVAVVALGRLKEPGRIPQFVRAAKHQQTQVRTAAAFALGNTFARDAAPHLIEMLKDDEDTVRKAAQAALDEIANYLDAKAKWEARLK
jgi:HEAT repeat protein